MALKLEFGKAFVSKAFIQDNRIFDGAALFETKFEDVIESYKICLILCHI